MARSHLIVVLSFIWVTLISAQGVTDVTCNVTSVNQWAFNAEKQSPCQVAANLGAVCATTGPYTIDALSPAFEHYYTPSPLATACECSSVIYSLAAACGLCQGGTFTTWLIWQDNCTAISPGFFPFSIPTNTFVPAWAYQDVQSTNSFSPATAQTVGDEPESSPAAAATSPQPTQSSSQNPTNNPTSSAPTGSSAPAPAPAPASSHKSSNTGAIAGGVVGGVVVIAILGALIFFIAKSKKKRAAQNGSDTQEFARNSEKYEPATPGGTTVYSPPPFSPGAENSQNYMSKPYDPNDPSTFPMSTGSPNPSGTPYNQSSYPHTVGGNSQYGQYTPDHTSMVGGGTPAPHHPGQYSGVAEV